SCWCNDNGSRCSHYSNGFCRSSLNVIYCDSCKLSNWTSSRNGFECFFCLYSSTNLWYSLGNGIIRCTCFWSYFYYFDTDRFKGKIINFIPGNLKLAVGAGIGFFIAFLGFQNAGIIIGDDDTLVSIGNLTSGPVMLAIFGIVISVVLLSLNIRGGIFYGMLLTSIAGMIFGLIPVPSGVSDVVSGVPSVAPTFGQAFVNFGDIFTLEMLVVMLTFLFVDFFDTAGTLVAVARQA